MRRNSTAGLLACTTTGTRARPSGSTTAYRPPGWRSGPGAARPCSSPRAPGASTGGCRLRSSGSKPRVGCRRRRAPTWPRSGRERRHVCDTATRRHGHPRKPGDGRTVLESALDRQEGVRGFGVTNGTGSDRRKALPEGRAETCAPGRTRTCGQALRRRLLYPLSYGGRVWRPVVVVPGPGPFPDIAGDKDRAPASLSLSPRLRGSVWRFGEAVLIIAGRYESCTAFGVSRTGCCALVMPGLRLCLRRPLRPLCPIGTQTCSYVSEFP